MQANISRRSFIVATAGAAALVALGASGCGSTQKAHAIRIGTMPTEDILPMWVAQAEGLFEEAGVEAEVIVFDSAQNLSAALTAGEVDIAMTDPMRAVKLCESGTELTMEWITLGATPQQGRFGVLTSANSGIASLADLVGSGKGVGVAANTVPEYVFDKLCEQAGVDPASIPTSEVASLPDRYSLVAAGQLDAAALPGSMLALGEQSGMIVIADDSTGDNLSQSVMVARAAYLADGTSGMLDAVRAVWDKAAQEINADPNAYRAILIENANLNAAVADTYPMSEYPLATTADGNPAYPPAELVDPVLAWMSAKGYLQSTVSYDESNGSFSLS